MKVLSSKKNEGTINTNSVDDGVTPCRRCNLRISIAKFDKILFLPGMFYLYISKHCSKDASVISSVKERK